MHRAGSKRRVSIAPLRSRALSKMRSGDGSSCSISRHGGCRGVLTGRKSYGDRVLPLMPDAMD
jgi:hypothetical protein